ncbi:MAG: DEAD/DEAH box helicase, partial [Planctomycetota bacterium]
DILLLLADHAILHDRVVKIAIDDSTKALAFDLLTGGPLTVPRTHEGDFVASLADLAQHVPALRLAVTVVDAGDVEPHFVIDLMRAMGQFFLGELRFAYGDTVVDYDSPAVMPAAAAGGPLRRRDPARERRAEARLMTAAAKDLMPTQMSGHYLIAKPQATAVAARLTAAGIRVAINGRPLRQSLGSRLTVRTDIDWFEIRGVIRFEGDFEVPVGAALAAIKRGEHTVELADGSQGLLPTAWLESWRQAAELGETKQDAVHLRRSQALLLDALLAARGTADPELHESQLDQGFRDVRTRLQQFQRVEPRSAPEHFTGTLRPYQETGLGWLHFLRDLQLGGCLADDMGLGKTVQVLALLLEVHSRPTKSPSLLVVPRSLLDNWRREAARFAPSLRVFDLHGTSRWERLEAAGGLAALDLIVTTYGTARIDVAKFEEWKLTWEYAILDEAQAIENAASLTSKSVRLLRARHRLALTGTPVQNHTGELWALFEFLNPGLLGKSRAFQKLLGDSERGEGLDLQLLHRALAPFLLRRTKADVLPDLPAKQEQDMLCEMDGSQLETYTALREHYQKLLLGGEQKLGAKERFVALEALLRLRQAACHEGLLDKTKGDRGSAKLDALLPMLQELVASGHKALVFSQFTEFLALVRTRLHALNLRYEYLDGATTKRQECVDRFQQDASCPLFLISLKAGGFGLNLTAADYVFLLDPWWNPAAETQAADRAHRIGQTQKVTVYRLITKDTVEEKVLQLQARKKQLVDAVLGADKSLLAKMTREDLAALLG